MIQVTHEAWGSKGAGACRERREEGASAAPGEAELEAGWRAEEEEGQASAARRAVGRPSRGQGGGRGWQH